MQADALGDIELDLLLQGVYRHYGYDFRDYARASLKRRVLQALQEERLKTISALQERALHNRECMERLLLILSVNVTSMFRDPDFYLAFREKVIPTLRTYPFIRIWNAGCSTGQEAYSLAIILQEEGLYSRSRIYATDMNMAALQQAQTGAFPAPTVRDSAGDYKEAGGTGEFADLFDTRSGRAVIDPALKKNITFAQHNLATDGAFNEFNVVLCRNVLIYFNRTLQDRVHDLLYSSLAPFGVLGLGKRETIRFTSHQRSYKELDGPARLYRKVGNTDP